MARTAFFDSIFRDALNQNIPQIVIIGAGYDTRAYRFAKSNKATNTENNKRTLFVLEGVSYYLEPESVAATLEMVSQAIVD